MKRITVFILGTLLNLCVMPILGVNNSEEVTPQQFLKAASSWEYYKLPSMLSKSPILINATDAHGHTALHLLISSECKRNAGFISTSCYRIIASLLRTDAARKEASELLGPAIAVVQQYVENSCDPLLTHKTKLDHRDINALNNDGETPLDTLIRRTLAPTILNHLLHYDVGDLSSLMMHSAIQKKTNKEQLTTAAIEERNKILALEKHEKKGGLAAAIAAYTSDPRLQLQRPIPTALAGLT